MMRPVATLPVKWILSTPPLTSAAPVVPSPSTRLNTPSGSPASAKRSPTIFPPNGVTSDGLATTVLPAIRAWTDALSVRMNGPFQGVITPTTPSGW